MRLYSIAIASLAVSAPVKWTDNLLAQHPLPDVLSRSRGVARGISWPGMVRIALIRALHLHLGCGVREAVVLAADLLRSTDSTLRLNKRLTLTVDRAALERDVQRRLADALESAPTPRRGRPARRDRDRQPNDPG